MRARAFVAVGAAALLSALLYWPDAQSRASNGAPVVDQAVSATTGFEPARQASSDGRRPAPSLPEQGAAGAAAPVETDATPEPTPDRVPMPPPVADVSEEEVLRYFARSAPNSGAEHSMHGFLDRVREELGLGFTRSVACRGSVCKTVLNFSDRNDPQRLTTASIPEGVEYMFKVEIAEWMDANLTILSTVRGTTFREALGGEDQRHAGRTTR